MVGGGLRTGRRCLLLRLALALGGLAPALGCGQERPRADSSFRRHNEEELARMHRFSGIGSYELWIDAFGPKLEQGLCAEIDDPQGAYVASGNFWQGKRGQMLRTMARTGLPPYLRVRLLEPDAQAYFDERGAMRWKGSEISDTAVPLAGRVPQVLLDDLRRDRQGLLRIKLRLHRDGVLVGWDVEYRPGLEPRGGRSTAAAYKHSGGDFKEARPADYIESQSACRACVAAAIALKKRNPASAPDDPNGFTSLPTGADLQGRVPQVLADHGYFIHANGALWEQGWYIDRATGRKVVTNH